ncbi:hypothetical protein DPMN_161951 [Dreissena polymorpha]|uniref:Uncharacterized protein n=1 Tax=Dreissena polymorpha TaxID=45954 RepID=A0A9D4ET31_DREPO|nr:hypothetical protein DPMN_161951 [Dreissena polymorpha]
MAITGPTNVQSITNNSTISVEQQQKCSNILAQSSKCNNPTASSCSPSFTENVDRNAASTTTVYRSTN